MHAVKGCGVACGKLFCSFLLQYSAWGSILHGEHGSQRSFRLTCAIFLVMICDMIDSMSRRGGNLETGRWMMMISFSP